MKMVSYKIQLFVANLTSKNYFMSMVTSTIQLNHGNEMLHDNGDLGV